MAAPPNTWGRSGFYRWIIRLGAVKGTVVATLCIDVVSVCFAVIVMLYLHRLSWMGVFISGTLPLFLVPLHWYPFARISEQLQATDAALRASEARYRSILEKMSEAYIEVDRDGALSFFNDSLCRISGYTRPELERRRIADFVSARDLRRLRDGAARAAGRHDRHRLRRPDHRQGWGHPPPRRIVLAAVGRGGPVGRPSCGDLRCHGDRKSVV
jgi:PAS domain S-box-containing protein